MLIMECILEAHPVPDITWYQGTKIITDNSRIKMFRKSTGRDTYLLTLEISNPTKADGGNYRCNAFNNFGESNANISLNFQGKSTRQGGCSRLQNRCMSAIHSQRREIQLLYCPITFFLQFTAIATNYRNYVKLPQLVFFGYNYFSIVRSQFTAIAPNYRNCLENEIVFFSDKF